MEDNKKINVKELLALCDIVLEFDEFNKNLQEQIVKRGLYFVVHDLDDLVNNREISIFNRSKKFYKENKTVIDKINKRCYISNFIVGNYDDNGNIKEKSDIDFFHKYLLAWKDKLEQIKSLLEKINELNINSLEFNNTLNFTKEEYEAYTDFNSRTRGFEFIYLDNMKAIPNYDNRLLKYKTLGSNYKISVNTSFVNAFNSGKITLNSLTFDAKRLPDKLSKAYVDDKIVELKNSEKDSCTSIQNSINLSMGVDDLDSKFNSVNKIIEQIENIEDKDELKVVLQNIKDNIDKLHNISNNYDDKISKDNKDITKDMLKDEKQKRLRYLNK